MTIDEGNKIIAEFMGLQVSGYDQFMGDDQVDFRVESLKYHESWQWIKPVIKKIEQINGKYLDIKGDARIMDVFSSIAEFIQVHNKQPS